jgi:adenylylsulfate kinase
MGWVMWLTGLPGSGKTTIAEETRKRLERKGISATRLELDEIRKQITPDPTYSDEEREIVYRSLGYMAKLLSDHEINVIIDATANRRAYREFARGSIPNFIEVYIKTPLDLCIEREAGRDARHAPKGIYDKSRRRGANVPGVNVVYEVSANPEIVIDTVVMSPQDAAGVITDWLMARGKK